MAPGKQHSTGIEDHGLGDLNERQLIKSQLTFQLDLRDHHDGRQKERHGEQPERQGS